MRDLQPDILFISITLAEIRSAERLIQQIHAKYNNTLPIVVGGSAFNEMKQHQNDTIDALLIKDASFDDIMKLVKVSLVDLVQQLNQPVEILQKPFGRDVLVNTIEDKEIYSELQKLNVIIDDIKAANLRHEQLRGVLEVLRNTSSSILQETQSKI